MGSVGAAPKRLLTLGDAVVAQKLYGDIRQLDELAVSMRRNMAKASRYWRERKSTADGDADRLCGTPLQSVNFAHHTATYSGPQAFQPTVNAQKIARLVLNDMAFQRDLLVKHLEAMGFDPPKKDKGHA